MILVADIGGSRTRLGCAGDASLENVVIADTPKSYEEGLAHLAAYKASLPEMPAAVSVGVAGRITDEKTLLTGHLPDWDNHAFAKDLAERLGIPAFVDNDTVMGALGEANEGAGTGANVVAYIAVGTGIGGRRVVAGEIDRSSENEFGHAKITIDGVEKEFEEFVSGSTIEREHGFWASDLHDPFEWDRYARCLAYGLKDVLSSWNPDRVVLGGYLPHDDRLSISNLEKHLAQAMPGHALPPFAYASLPYSGLTGARIYAKRALSNA